MSLRSHPRLRIFAALVGLAFVAPPVAADVQEPGSLLVFQEYDNRAGVATLLSVTNVADSEGTLVEWRYYEKDFCLEFNRTDSLTPRDTLSLLTNFHNPGMEQGYVLVFAKNELGEARVFNHLIGTTLAVDGLSSFSYGVNPVVFEGIGDGNLTDLDSDGQLDLDGVEYGMGPDQLLFPRFLGQGGLLESELLLIDMSGGAGFTTNVGVLLYNDNEESFSAEHAFSCWTRVALEDVSLAFSNDFLANATLHDPDEILGAPEIESGWFRLNGVVASDETSTIEDPLILALLVESSAGHPAAGRPFHIGLQGQGAPVLPPECPEGVQFELWPPNHAYHDLDLDMLAGVVDPGGLAVSIVITSITQDEPINGPGDGNTVCDGYGVGTNVASIRSERRGGGNGRVYRVSYTATNSAGESCDGALEVSVPHSQNGQPAVDDGQLHDSTEGC